jgi:hypothetical protein
MSDHDDVLALLAARDPLAGADLSATARDARAQADLRAILAGTPARPPARRAARWARPALGAAGFAAAGGLVGVLLLAGPDGGDREAARAIPPGGWGLEATVAVRPDPGGLTPERATARAAEIVRARAAARGMEGVVAEPAGGGTLRVVVPWAIQAWEVEVLAAPADAAVYDLRRSRVADSRDPARALAALRAPAGGAGGAWYGFSAGRRPVPVTGPWTRPGGGDRSVNWVRARAGLRAVLVPRSVLGLPTRANVAYPPSWVVLRDPPLVGPDDVRDVRPTGRADLRLSVDGGPPAGAGPLLMTASGGGLPLGTPAVPAGATAVRARSSDLVNGRVAVRWLAGGGLAAALSVESTGVLGTPPPRRGDRVRPPAAVRRVLGGPGTSAFPRVGATRPATTLRVVHDGGFAVWEALTVRGQTVVAAGPSATGGYGITTNCTLGATARTLAVCMRGDGRVWGRVAPAVAAVRVRAGDGTASEATVRNGWFLARVAREDGARIVAVDTAGRRIATIRP